MKNLIVIFLFLFSLNCFAQDSTNSIDFKFEKEYVSTPSSLYLKCANDIRFSISDKTKLKKLSYKVTGADLIIKDKAKHLVLIPNSAKVTLEVLYKGKTILEQDFTVKMIPQPSIKVAELSNKALTEFPQKITVSVSADATFIKELPADARYRASSYTVTLAKGKKRITQKVFTHNEQFTEEETQNYTNLIKTEPNEEWKLIIEVTEIQRMNYKDEVEKVMMRAEVFSLPIQEE